MLLYIRGNCEAIMFVSSQRKGDLRKVGRLFDCTFSQWGIVHVDKVEIERQTIWEQRGHRIVKFESRFTERIL